ncbi:DUF7096 domain-containing protein [Natrinema versiforme]|uniref:Uncharacterized protein n=1 Tax=Natrinema versiforme JCM 10478 TaxID=1227496 RepID=L9Y782_9EURY|nr:hypothetical protein [Natrinema versiforme]ELY68793.1 hypothetical protein C489_06818 [Natrinema versiforme JCM 10478]
MNNAIPAFLAFLLVVSLPAMTIVAAEPEGEINGDAENLQLQVSSSQSTPVAVDNTTNRLGLSGEVRSEYTEYGPNLGMALASADDQLRVDHDQYTIVDSEFDSATVEEREAMIQAGYERLRQRMAELEQREREAAAAYAAGERSSTEFLQTLLRNHNEAAMLSESIEELDNRADRVPGYSLSASQTRADQKTLNYHRTPLRSTLAQLSERPTGDVRHDIVVSTSQNGYSVAIMAGNQYIVETSRFDNRDETGSERFENGEAYNHISTLYPWASEFGSGPHFQDNSPGYYWVEMGHDHGRLDFYFDSRTGDVYREVQQLSASSLPQTDVKTWSRDGINMTITETPANGPVEITVTDPETGDPAQATITADGVELGETGEDGSLWIVQPIGRYDITAETESGSVNATITDNF